MIWGNLKNTMKNIIVTALGICRLREHGQLSMSDHLLQIEKGRYVWKWKDKWKIVFVNFVNTTLKLNDRFFINYTSYWEERHLLYINLEKKFKHLKFYQERINLFLLVNVIRTKEEIINHFHLLTDIWEQYWLKLICMKRDTKIMEIT